MKSDFDDKDLTLIFKKALEIQNKEVSGDKPNKFSRQDVYQIGEEIGLKKDLIQKALSELQTEDSLNEKGFFGGKINSTFETIIEKELSEDDLRDISSKLEFELGLKGISSISEKELVWKTAAYDEMRTGSGISLSVSVGGGESYVKINDRHFGLAGGLFGGIAGGAGIGFGVGFGLPIGLVVLNSPLFCVLFPAAVIAGGFLAARSIFKKVVRKKRGKIKKVLDIIQDK